MQPVFTKSDREEMVELLSMAPVPTSDTCGMIHQLENGDKQATSWCGVGRLGRGRWNSRQINVRS